MITEDYVSYETAKLLKEKGFDVYVSSFYNDEGGFSRTEVDWNWNIGPHYSAPTLQMAMKWLREVHKLYISVEMGFDGDYFFFELSVLRFFDKPGEYEGPFDEREREFNTYEEACETGIRYCLENLI